MQGFLQPALGVVEPLLLLGQLLLGGSDLLVPADQLSDRLATLFEVTTGLVEIVHPPGEIRPRCQLLTPLHGNLLLPARLLQLRLGIGQGGSRSLMRGALSAQDSFRVAGTRTRTRTGFLSLQKAARILRLRALPQSGLTRPQGGLPLLQLGHAAQRAVPLPLAVPQGLAELAVLPLAFLVAILSLSQPFRAPPCGDLSVSQVIAQKLVQTLQGGLHTLVSLSLGLQRAEGVGQVVHQLAS